MDGQIKPEGLNEYFTAKKNTNLRHRISKYNGNILFHFLFDFCFGITGISPLRQPTTIFIVATPVKRHQESQYLSVYNYIIWPSPCKWIYHYLWGANYGIIRIFEFLNFWIFENFHYITFLFIFVITGLSPLTLTTGFFIPAAPVKRNR